MATAFYHALTQRPLLSLNSVWSTKRKSVITSASYTGEETMMADLAQPVDSALALEKLELKTKRLSTWTLVFFIVLLIVIASACAGGFFLWKKAKALDAAQKDLAFSQFITDTNHITDFVVPQVNTIQFLKRGYSITFDTVKYTQEGLLLSGTLGNGTELYLNSLAVNFVARPYPYKIKEKFEKQTFPWWSDEWNIGSGQTNVGVLGPGTSVPFTVSIPNVKQTADSIEIAVSFSGERYSYLK